MSHLTLDVCDWPNNPRRSTVAVRVNECAVFAVARVADWWVTSFRAPAQEARICVETSSIGGDRVHVHCENREHADWLAGHLLDRGVHKSALKVIRTNCEAQ